MTQSNCKVRAILVLQGRVRSTRLPAKGFFHFFDKTVWARMCEIALNCSFADKVIFATGDDGDKYLAQSIAMDSGIELFVGSESNVYERFYKVSKKFPSEYIVRVTCDNYLAQPELLEDIFNLVESQNADYGFIEPLSHYAGEVIRSSLFDNYRNPSEEAQEHVTWDFRGNDRISKVSLPLDYKGIDHSNSITLDNIDDFILMKKIESSSEVFREVRCVKALQELDLDRILSLKG